MAHGASLLQGLPPGAACRGRRVCELEPCASWSHLAQGGGGGGLEQHLVATMIIFLQHLLPLCIRWAAAQGSPGARGAARAVGRCGRRCLGPCSCLSAARSACRAAPAAPRCPPAPPSSPQLGPPPPPPRYHQERCVKREFLCPHLGRAQRATFLAGRRGQQGGWQGQLLAAALASGAVVTCLAASVVLGRRWAPHCRRAASRRSGAAAGRAAAGRGHRGPCKRAGTCAAPGCWVRARALAAGPASHWTARRGARQPSLSRLLVRLKWGCGVA
jgi:hypothetical protein